MPFYYYKSKDFDASKPQKLKVNVHMALNILETGRPTMIRGARSYRSFLGSFVTCSGRCNKILDRQQIWTCNFQLFTLIKNHKVATSCTFSYIKPSRSSHMTNAQLSTSAVSPGGLRLELDHLPCKPVWARPDLAKPRTASLIRFSSAVSTVANAKRSGCGCECRSV